MRLVFDDTGCFGYGIFPNRFGILVNQVNLQGMIACLVARVVLNGNFQVQIGIPVIRVEGGIDIVIL